MSKEAQTLYDDLSKDVLPVVDKLSDKILTGSINRDQIHLELIQLAITVHGSAFEEGIATAKGCADKAFVSMDVGLNPDGTPYKGAS